MHLLLSFSPCKNFSVHLLNFNIIRQSKILKDFKYILAVSRLLQPVVTLPIGWNYKHNVPCSIDTVIQTMGMQKSYIQGPVRTNHSILTSKKHHIQHECDLCCLIENLKGHVNTFSCSGDLHLTRWIDTCCTTYNSFILCQFKKSLGTTCRSLHQKVKYRSLYKA